MERGFRSSICAGSRRSRWSLAVTLALALAIFVSLPAQAATATDTLDQQQLKYTSFQPLNLMAQTFTAGLSGQLDRVSLASDSTSFGATITVTVEIHTLTAAGLPSTTAPLGSSKFQGKLQCCGQFHDFVFSPAASITAGTKYAIVVKASGGSFKWWNLRNYDNYPGGQMYVSCSGCAWLTGSTYGTDFAFQTWVVASAKGPAVAADSPSVSVPEGTAPANTGTYSDDGRTVTITASTGTITNQAGTSAGTWSWTAAATDEPSTTTVTITADDGNGLATQTYFTVTVLGAKPIVTIASATFSAAPSHLSAATLSTGVPSSLSEGTKVTLNGAASSPSAQDNAAGFTYSWTVTKDGNPFGGSNSPTVSFTVDDEATFQATFQATDDGGQTNSASANISGAEVIPTAHITLVQPQVALVLTANEAVNFAGTFTDSGTADTDTQTWSFGDGGAASGPTATHSFTAAGTYTVTYAVEDDDRVRGTASTTVIVQTPQQAMNSISAYTQNIKTLNAGQKNSLMAKINAANASMARGDRTAANNQLNALLNELQAYVSTGKISTTDASTLRSAVHAVQGALGTYNRFLEWWPLGA